MIVSYWVSAYFPLAKEIPDLETIISRFHVNFWGKIM